MGLAYHSAFYKYLRVAVSFRAVGVLYENDTDSIWGAGKLTIQIATARAMRSRDFYINDCTKLGQSYLEYFDGNTSIKAGRILKYLNGLIGL